MISSFNENGFLILKNFIPKNEIITLQQQIHELSLGIDNQLEPEQAAPHYSDYNKVDRHLLALLQKNRIKQSILYDRLQQITGLLALPSNPKINSIAKALLQTRYLGVWPRVQLRFDIHGDKFNLINWHHDYLYNKGTEASITFWIPLVETTSQMGPIKIARGSHKQAYSFIQVADARFNFTLANDIVDGLDIVDYQEYNAGDVCILHSKTIHTGCLNEDSERARLTCVFRLQDLTKLENVA